MARGVHRVNKNEEMGLLRGSDKRLRVVVYYTTVVAFIANYVHIIFERLLFQIDTSL